MRSLGQASPQEAALQVAEGAAQGLGEARPLGRGEVAGDDQAAAAETTARRMQAELVVDVAVEAGPERIEAPFPRLAAMADPADEERDRRQFDLLEGAALPEADVEGEERARRSSPKKPATGQKPRMRKGRLATALAMPQRIITIRKPPRSSERCGRITAAKTGSLKRLAASDIASARLLPSCSPLCHSRAGL